MDKNLESFLKLLTQWMHSNVLTTNTAAQWLCAVVAFGLVLIIWHSLQPRALRWAEESTPNDLIRSLLKGLVSIGDLTLFLILAQLCAAFFYGMGKPPRVLDAVSNLAVAGIVIRLASRVIPNKSLARGAATFVWIVAGLHVIGLLAPITSFLRSLSFTSGDSQFTALGAIKGLLLATICLQVAAMTARYVSKRIENVEDLSPSIQVLMIKAVKVGLYTVAILFAMSSVGINLTSLAIFSSALGVGIGFGLKTIFSNYVAGILLLLDNSIKPGDTIEVGQVFGVVRDMHGRYTSVLTRDGTEYLIPNELLIAGEVVNWTYSDSNVRIKIPVGIAYHSNVKLAMKLLEKAASDVDRVLKDPAPAARLTGFGDNSVDLQLRVWIADAEDGVANIRSAVFVKIWELYHEHGIEFPFPQRDILLKPESELSVKIKKDEAND